MSLNRRIHVVLTILIILGSFMLGIGRQQFFWAWVTALASLAALYLSEFRGWRLLTRGAANLTALACVSFTLWRFVTGQQSEQLLTIADLLIYLQLILLFQEKHERLYWQVGTLSLLQIVVASALTTSLWFGILLVLYMLVGLVFLWLLNLRRGLSFTAKSSSQAGSPAERFSPGVSLDPASDSLILEKVAWPSVGTILSWGLCQVVLAGVFFLLMPRAGASFVPGGSQVMPQRTTGFSENVQLGALGEISQNEVEALRIHFVDSKTNQTLPIAGPVLLRGSVQTCYDSPGRWSDPWDKDWGRASAPERPPRSLDYVRQEIVQQPMQEKVLFSVFPLRTVENYFVPSRSRLVNKSVEKGPLHYQLDTLGFQDGKQREIMPLWEDKKAALRNGMQLPAPKPEGGADPLSELKALAAQILADSGLPEEDTIGRARKLESHLRDSGRYSYSLAGQPRDPGRDPIDDFIAVHREGHCEYFASALCLMLRSSGIEARLALGFHPDYNSLSEEYVALNLHAHAWVEAYIPPEQIPAEARGSLPEEMWKQGGWLILNPTPGGGDPIQAGPGWLKWWRDSVDYAQLLWSRYVVGLNALQQAEWIYQPIANAFMQVADWLTEDLPHAVQKVWRQVGTLVWGALGAAVAGLVAYRLRRKRWRKNAVPEGLRAGKTNGRLGTKVGEVPPFFRRWEVLLAKRQLQRASAQTQREFVGTLFAKSAESTGNRLTQLSQPIVDAYYRVRFGGHALDKPEAEAVEHALQELEALSVKS